MYRGRAKDRSSVLGLSVHTADRADRTLVDIAPSLQLHALRSFVWICQGRSYKIQRLGPRQKHGIHENSVPTFGELFVPVSRFYRS